MKINVIMVRRLKFQEVHLACIFSLRLFAVSLSPYLRKKITSVLQIKILGEILPALFKRLVINNITALILRLREWRE
jgi:hypothetical protein